MNEELVFTSAPRGLQIGTSGFCTVASTPGMASNLARLLQSLSGYRHLHAPGSPSAHLNPVVYSHLKAKVGGKRYYIVSRIADAGFDYSNRTNKIAHHIALSRNLPTTGPSGVLSNEGLFYNSWNQDPEKLSPRMIAGVPSEPSACKNWASICGDAGWAGDVIEAVKTKRQVYLVIDEKIPALNLIHELVSLLPPSERWDLSFSTFFTKLPPSIECSIRFLIAGSPEISIATRKQSNLVLDLTSPLPKASGKFANAARSGFLIGSASFSTSQGTSADIPKLRTNNTGENNQSTDRSPLGTVQPTSAADESISPSLKLQTDASPTTSPPNLKAPPQLDHEPERSGSRLAIAVLIGFLVVAIGAGITAFVKFGDTSFFTTTQVKNDTAPEVESLPPEEVEPIKTKTEVVDQNESKDKEVVETKKGKGENAANGKPTDDKNRNDDKTDAQQGRDSGESSRNEEDNAGTEVRANDPIPLNENDVEPMPLSKSLSKYSEFFLFTINRNFADLPPLEIDIPYSPSADKDEELLNFHVNKSSDKGNTWELLYSEGDGSTEDIFGELQIMPTEKGKTCQVQLTMKMDEVIGIDHVLGQFRKCTIQLKNSLQTNLIAETKLAFEKKTESIRFDIGLPIVNQNTTCEFEKNIDGLVFHQDTESTLKLGKSEYMNFEIERLNRKLVFKTHFSSEEPYSEFFDEIALIIKNSRIGWDLKNLNDKWSEELDNLENTKKWLTDLLPEEEAKWPKLSQVTTNKWMNKIKVHLNENSSKIKLNDYIEGREKGLRMLKSNVESALKHILSGTEIRLTNEKEPGKNYSIVIQDNSNFRKPKTQPQIGKGPS